MYSVKKVKSLNKTFSCQVHHIGADSLKRLLKQGSRLIVKHYVIVTKIHSI